MVRIIISAGSVGRDVELEYVRITINGSSITKINYCGECFEEKEGFDLLKSAKNAPSGKHDVHVDYFRINEWVSSKNLTFQEVENLFGGPDDFR